MREKKKKKKNHYFSNNFYNILPTNSLFMHHDNTCDSAFI